MRWLLFGVTLLVTIAAAIAVIGAFLPVAHVATASADVPDPPDRVWTTLTTVDAFPTWRPGVVRVETLAPGSWRETTRHGAMTYATVAADPPRRLVTRIADRNLPFGGEWEYTITPTATGSHVTITERGEIYNPLFRFVSRYIIGYTATMTAVLQALAQAPARGR
jgi:uncharacterized protein YndB with AHSA1/START domain